MGQLRGDVNDDKVPSASYFTFTDQLLTVINELSGNIITHHAVVEPLRDEVVQ